MKTSARVIETLVIVWALAYGVFATKKWVDAERRASYSQGRWDVYESFAEDPKGLKKW